MSTCPKCGKALEMTQVVMGREYTHPCACRCMIEEFERAQQRAERKQHEKVYGDGETRGQSEAAHRQRSRVHA